MRVFQLFILYNNVNQRSIISYIFFPFRLFVLSSSSSNYYLISFTGNANVVQQQQAAMQLQIAAQQAEEGAAGGGGGSGSPSIPTNGDLPAQHAPPLQVSGEYSSKFSAVCAYVCGSAHYSNLIRIHSFKNQKQQNFILITVNIDVEIVPAARL
jgi:hypothetical protein